jgi:hypothetical protein
MSDSRRSLSGLRVSSAALSRVIAVSATVVGLSLAGSTAGALASTGGSGLGGSVFISEVYTHGADAADNVVSHGDWIELYNAGGSNQSLNGAVLTDDNDSHQLALPNVTLAPGDAVAFRTDPASAGAGAFDLGDVDEARLFASSADIALGATVDELDWTHSPIYSWAKDFDNAPLGDPTQADWLPSASLTQDADNDSFDASGAPSISGVVINEVNMNGGADGDWIELYNTNGSGSVDLTGAILSDSDNTHAYVIGQQAGDQTSISSHDFATYRVDDPAVNGSFGLGGNDAARLFGGDIVDLFGNGAGPADNTGTAPTVDWVGWASAPTFTYARVNDGNGLATASTNNFASFQATTAATHDASNNSAGSAPPFHDLSGVVINEVKSTGDPDHGDWIELYNTGGTTRDLSSAILSDNNDAHVIRISNGTSLAGGAILTIRTDTDGGTKDSGGSTLASQPATGTFGLGDADSARLFAANLITLSGATPVDSFTWTQHAPTSYGRKAGQTTTNTNSSTVWGATNNPTFNNASNDFSNSTSYDLSFIQLNESASREMSPDPIANDFIEIINTAPSSLNVNGMILSDNDNSDAIVLSSSTVVGGSTSIAAGGVLYVKVDSSSVTGHFGLGSNDAARLFMPSATVATSIPVDHNEWTDHATLHQSYQRQNGGLGGWADCGPMTPGSTNTSC